PRRSVHRLMGHRRGGGERDRLPERSGRRAAPGSAARAPAGDAAVCTRCAAPRGRDRGSARALRDCQRPRQPDSALASHPAPPFPTLAPPSTVRHEVRAGMPPASSIGAPIARAAAGPAFVAFGSRQVVAVAAAGQLAAMSYAALVTVRYLAKEGT